MPPFQLNHQLYEKWQNYKHPLVRQLAFAIGSPNILTHLPPELEITYPFTLHCASFWQKHLENYHQRLLQLDQQPDELIHFVSTLKSTRLGLRFEMLVWFWLLDDAYHPYQLLGHSIQKIDGARTVGELDFVLRNTETNKIEHWEVALKYYLAEADLTLPHWYGLNRSDTLNRKLKHFTQKQFQFEQALDHVIDTRYCMLKGQLYVPSHIKPSDIPSWVNLERRIGIWGHQIPATSLNYYRLQRHEWIYPEPEPTSETPIWWTDGLYKQRLSNAFYMYRQPNLIQM